MNNRHNRRFHKETDQYRLARNELLEAEIVLRKQIENVARMRRALPLGGELKMDYEFTTLSNNTPSHTTEFSDLFVQGKDTLVVYSFMYGSAQQAPCPMCTAFLDSLNSNARYLHERINLAVVAKAPITLLRDFAKQRKWGNLNILSSEGTSYNQDYFGENDSGQQIPCMNVFQQKNNAIYHFYSTELLFVDTETGEHPRHIDMMWPLWNVLDLTPDGRGTDWYPNID